MRGRPERGWRGAAACLLALGLLTACGDQTSTAGSADEPSEPASSPSPSAPSSPVAPSSTATASSLPACTEVWVADQDLPRGYRGCADDAGAAVEPEEHRCSYGRTIVTHADRYYAVAGSVINEVDSLDASQQFRRALSACQA